MHEIILDLLFLTLIVHKSQRRYSLNIADVAGVAEEDICIIVGAYLVIIRAFSIQDSIEYSTTIF